MNRYSACQRQALVVIIEKDKVSKKAVTKL